MTAVQVRAFYDANVGAARAHLYVAGRFDPAAMEAAVRDAFGGWKAGTPVSFAPPSPRTARAIHLIDRPGAVQSTIVIGMPVIDPTNPDYVPLLVTNTLLGGYFSSRITSNIREAKGYTYSPFSQVSVRYRDAYWAQNADVTTNVTGPSLKEIFYEIDRLQGEPPSADELKARTLLERESSASSSSWTCTACLTTICRATSGACMPCRLPTSSGWRRSTSRTTRPRSSWSGTRR